MIVARAGQGKVNFDVHGGATGPLLGVVSFNDPARMNAMSEAMANSFLKVTANVDAVGPAAIAVTGEGHAFSAGDDLQMMRRKQTQLAEVNCLEMFAFYSFFLGILDLNIPLIAAINGPAVGAGLCFACACDVHIAADIDKKILGFGFATLGIAPGMGGTLFLPPLVGADRARALLEDTNKITPHEALDIGLVGEVVPQESLMDRAFAEATEIASSPEMTSDLLSKRIDREERVEGLKREATRQGASFLSDEHLTKFPAFLEALKSSRS